MPSLIDLRRRIRSVKNTRQITKAMKVVSAAKLRRAQDRVLSARPYAEIIERKSRDFFKKRSRNISGEYAGIFQKVVRYEDALEIAQKVIERFRKAEIDSVYLVGNNFKSMMASQLVLNRILPIELPEKQEQIDYIYEQPPAELLAALLPRYIEPQILRALLESAAAEHAARMTAMEAASSNAADVIDALTLKM